MYIHFSIKLLGNNMMNKIFERIKSEFDLFITRLDTSGIRTIEILDEKVVQEMERIRLNYDDLNQAREYVKDKYSDIYHCVNIRRNYDINGYLYWARLNFYWGEHEWRQGDQTEGVWFMVQATKALALWQGYLDGLDRREHEESIQQRRKNSGSKGGFKRAGRYQPVKEELIRLLKEEKPETGWKTKRDAVDTIEPKLWRFIDGPYRKAFNKESIQRRKAFELERKPFSMVRESLDRTMLDWSRNDEAIKNAFQQVICRESK